MIEGSGFTSVQNVKIGGNTLTGSQLNVISDTKIEILSTPPNAPRQESVTVQTNIATSNVATYQYFNYPIDWTKGTLLSNEYGPSAVTFGPDGRLYVGTVTGKVFRFTLDDDYNVIEELTVETSIINEMNPNSPNPEVPTRAILALHATLWIHPSFP